MSSLQRTSQTLALSVCLLAPTSLQAAQIRQPDSILPVNMPTASHRSGHTATITDPTSMNQSKDPAWLIKAENQPVRKQLIGTKFPMVESGNFSNLGQIRTRTTPNREFASRSNSTSKKSNSNLSQGFLRALGIQAARPTRHR